ncbi:MAG TPA: LytTR family DNA-binding domain-containing protein [Bacteroidales bacterium]|nr:LytTR family DNA-binding domain-containing protein [Bacteroidales bacterium]
MWNIFNKPYPFSEDLKHNSKIIFFISLGVFAFLFLFQPFEISNLSSKDRYYFMAGVSVVTFLALSINLLLLPSLFTKMFSSSKWNIKKEIFWNLWILFTILGGYFLLNTSLHVLHFDFSMVIQLVLTAVVPISILIIVNYNKILRAHSKLADELSKKLKENKLIQEKIVHFQSDYQKDSLAIKVNLLMIVRSANNYIEVFWKEGETIKSQMVRSSMISAEELLKEHKFIFKCHRSYIVNINYIDKIEGNSQGYKLFFDDISFPVPVSRNSVEKLKELI